MTLEQHARNIRRKIIQATNTKFDGHFGGCLSAADIHAVLFGGVMNVAPEKVNDALRDRYVLSKGHCALCLYAALNEFGFLSDDEYMSFHAEGGDFQTHAVKNPQKGIEISTGSLGMGFSMACGIATALKATQSPSRVFVLVGNGEANEGIFWEAAVYAGAKKLSNLIVVMDDNKMQNDGSSEKVLLVKNWTERLSSFGWKAITTDGHDLMKLKMALSSEHEDCPLFVCANTIKGKGVPFMENAPEWHHNKMTMEQYDAAIKALEEGRYDI